MIYYQRYHHWLKEKKEIDCCNVVLLYIAIVLGWHGKFGLTILVAFIFIIPEPCSLCYSNETNEEHQDRFKGMMMIPCTTKQKKYSDKMTEWGALRISLHFKTVNDARKMLDQWNEWLERDLSNCILKWRFFSGWTRGSAKDFKYSLFDALRKPCCLLASDWKRPCIVVFILCHHTYLKPYTVLF